MGPSKVLGAFEICLYFIMLRTEPAMKVFQSFVTIDFDFVLTRSLVSPVLLCNLNILHEFKKKKNKGSFLRIIYFIPRFRKTI